MATVVMTRPHSPRNGPRSCSLHVPRHGMADGDRVAASIRSTRTDPDIALNGLDLSYFDAKATWEAFAESTKLDCVPPGDDPGSEAVVIPSIEIDGDIEDDAESSPPPSPKPFQKWMQSLHKRARRSAAGDMTAPYDGPVEVDSNRSRPHLLTRQSSSGSSMAFVTAVRSASISLASTSLMAPRRRLMARSSHGWTDRSSRASTPAPRFSGDSYFEGPVHSDKEVIERSLQRRRILEELLRTEESYISDVRFLMNVYVTILASLPAHHEGLRQSINRNLTEIIELHEEMLGELHCAVPDSEYIPLDIPTRGRQSTTLPVRHHHRWHSLDSVDEHRGKRKRPQTNTALIADPDVAAEVARVFARRIHRFFVYEEYGAKYEMMIKDVASATQTMPGWNSYQRGLEALAASVGSESQHLDASKKSLTIADLLVKPIQRVCRYPLLFSELLKYTPAYDCPNSHMEIENALFRLREATSEINRATDDPDAKASLEKTWLIQDRLTYPEQTTDAASRSRIRAFGQVQLCGALYICWQTSSGVQGSYMVSLLYKDRLCLATADKCNQIYYIQLCIGLREVRLEEVDNGRGLQCHTAPFSWKLVFEHDCQLYEIIMTACNAKEEAEWRSHLQRPEGEQFSGIPEVTALDSMSLCIKSIGTIFGKPGTVARRVSIQRATTVGSKSALCQVVLKNTTTVKDSSAATTLSTISRSQSLLTTNPRNTLAPTIAERMRLEALLADVWSKECLPFPGMSGRSRSEQLVRSSASTVIRKLSVASISSSFAKRAAPVAPAVKRQDSRSVPRTSYGELTFATDDGGGDTDFHLPVIEDTFEKSRSSAFYICGDMPGASDSTRCFKATKSYEVMRRGEDMLTYGSPILRTASINSSRPQSSSIKSLSPHPVEKENLAQQQALPIAREPQGPLGKQWARVKTMNRELRSSGLRRLFR